MYSLDVALTQTINKFAGHIAVLDGLFIFLSWFGIPTLLVVVVLQTWKARNSHLVRFAMISAFVALLLGLGVNEILSTFFDRVRPYDANITQLLVAPSFDPSFPSNHAMAGMTIAVSYLIFEDLRRQGLLLLLAALLLGLSRVYVGTQYFGDITGGWIVGIAAALVASAFFHPEGRLGRLVRSVL